MKIRPEYGYSFGNITAESRDVDSFTGEDSGVSDLVCSGRMEIIVPDPTNEDRERYNLAQGEDWDNGEQAACEYRDSFVPMMNSLWPVALPYGREAEQSAALMNQHGGATSLVSIDGDHYIAMTGGGMDLSWHIAAAYVCCGAVPPIYILDALKGSPFRLSDAINREILTAAKEGVRHLRDKAKRLSDDINATAAQLNAPKGKKRKAA